MISQIEVIRQLSDTGIEISYIDVIRQLSDSDSEISQILVTDNDTKYPRYKSSDRIYEISYIEGTRQLLRL